MSAWRAMALAAAAALTACAGPAAKPAIDASTTAVETASAGAYEFALEGDRLRYTGPTSGAHAIGTPMPCRLSRNPDGQVRTHEVGSQLVFLVVCSRVEREIAGRPLCDTLVRGVVVTSEGVRLPDRAQRVRVCPPFAWDEQVFVYFVES